jgi:UDP:flavonoid glycosyltransferase YjiC (YdhE family)
VLVDAVDRKDEATWLAETPRPIVHFTLGTFFNLESGDLFERVLEGLSDLEASVVVTVGRDLGPQRANIRVERHLPQSLLLPHCELVVSHGGFGGVVGALAHGLPVMQAAAEVLSDRRYRRNDRRKRSTACRGFVE